jgi:hypothetical protein
MSASITVYNLYGGSQHRSMDIHDYGFGFGGQWAVSRGLSGLLSFVLTKHSLMLMVKG